MRSEVMAFLLMKHLTSLNKQLFRDAKVKKRSLGYKYLWIRNGKIFIRKTDTSQAIAITSDEDILAFILWAFMATHFCVYSSYYVDTLVITHELDDTVVYVENAWHLNYRFLMILINFAKSLLLRVT